MSVNAGMAIALIMLKALRELNLAYFALLRNANMSEEDKVILRHKFKEVALEDIPKPEDLK
jgi:hypothetical protein